MGRCLIIDTPDLIEILQAMNGSYSDTPDRSVTEYIKAAVSFYSKKVNKND